MDKCIQSDLKIIFDSSVRIHYKFYLQIHSPGFIFHNQADVTNEHFQTSLANIDGDPLAVGGNSSYTKAEILDIASNTWTEIAEYPYHDL